MEMMKNHTVHTGEKRQGKYQTEKKKKSMHSKEICDGKDRSARGKRKKTGDQGRHANIYQV